VIANALTNPRSLVKTFDPEPKQLPVVPDRTHGICDEWLYHAMCYHHSMGDLRVAKMVTQECVIRFAMQAAEATNELATFG
jgi:hypothetical protein